MRLMKIGYNNILTKVNLISLVIRHFIMADTEDSHSLNSSGVNSVYPGEISHSRDGHMIFSSAIKQENGGLLGKSSCTGLIFEQPFF